MLMVTVLILLAVFLYLKLYKPFKYWREKGIAYSKPTPIVGNVGPVVFRRRALADHLRYLYSEFPDQRYFGFYQFTMPTLMIRDPELIKDILIANFDIMPDRKEFLPKTVDALWGRGIFAETGQRWRELRAVLSPVFTGSKMKIMFPSINEIAQRFANHLQAQDKFITMEFNEIFERYTNDAIATVAFGVECDSIKHRDNEFFRLGSNAFNFSGLKSLNFFGFAISPTLMKLLGFQFFDKKVKSFFHELIQDSIKHREESGIKRPDLVEFLREAQKSKPSGDSNSKFPQYSTGDKPKTYQKINLTDEDITSQALLFFFGGFEAVARLICHISYELALHPDVQKRLIKEVDNTLEECNGQITYDALMSMIYLDMVTSETLRLWSSGIGATRQNLKPFTIEPKLPDEKPLHLDIGTAIVIPICALHRDPKYFPNPAKFDPERFSEENKHKIKPYTYIPFAVGPRNCIARRLGLVEAKIMIFQLLTRFEIVPVKETTIPLELSKTSALISSDSGYWLGLKPRQKID